MAANALDTSIQNFQAIIDAAESQNAALYTQRNALKAQMRTLHQQIAALNQQIASSETALVKKARTAKKLLDFIRSGDGDQRLIQRLGLE